MVGRTSWDERVDDRGPSIAAAGLFIMFVCDIGLAPPQASTELGARSGIHRRKAISSGVEREILRICEPALWRQPFIRLERRSTTTFLKGQDQARHGAHVRR